MVPTELSSTNNLIVVKRVNVNLYYDASELPITTDNSLPV